MVLLIIEILLVLSGFAVLVASAVKMIRQAAALARSAKKLQEEAQPKAARLSMQADTARELGLHVAERSELLQRRGEVLSVAMGRLMVLVKAASEAKSKLDKVTGYIGL
jgi:hypothetical protein